MTTPILVPPPPEEPKGRFLPVSLTPDIADTARGDTIHGQANMNGLHYAVLGALNRLAEEVAELQRRIEEIQRER